MNLLVEVPDDPYKLKVNEEVLKYIVEKTENPPIIVTCIGSGSFYNEFSVDKFLTCLKSRSDFTIIEAKVTHDRDATKGITLWREIYRKNRNSAEDQAIFVFNLSRDYTTTDENYFNQLVAFAKIISSVILQTDYGILWKDIDGRVSRWIENQEKVLNKKARVARRYSEDFCKFGEEIFANVLVECEKITPKVFGDFVRYVANLVETELHPILNGVNGRNGQNPNENLDKLENNSDVEMSDLEIRDRSNSISLNAESLPTPTHSSSSDFGLNINLQPQSITAIGANQNIFNSKTNETEPEGMGMEFENQPKSISHQGQGQALVKTKISETQVEQKKKTCNIETQTDHKLNHKEMQTDENCILVPVIDERPLIIMTKDLCLNKQIQEIIVENIYKEIEKKVEEIHYTNTDHILSTFAEISKEKLSQIELYQSEQDQNHSLVLGRNLMPTLEIFFEKFQTSKLFQKWVQVFTVLDLLYKILSQSFLENMKNMQDLNFSGWDLSKWAENLMSNICNEYAINLNFFKEYTNETMGFGKVLKNFHDIIKAISFYNDEANNYFTNNMQNSTNAKFEDQFSEYLKISVSKVELNEIFLSAGEYFPQILNESVKIRNQVYEKMYLEKERKMQEDCAKLAKFMKTKFESKMNEFFPTKILSTSKQIKKIANEFKTFCFEYFSSKFQLGHEGVSEIWKNLGLDMEDVVRNTILKIDGFGSELEKILFTIETSTYKLAESKASALSHCQEELASHFRKKIYEKSNLLFDDRIQKINQNIEANFSTYQEKYKVSIQANSSQIQDPLNANESENTDINVCINLDYDMIQITIIKDNSGKINLDKPHRKFLKNQIGLDPQGLLCIGQKAENLKNKIHGSEILNPDTQFDHEIGNMKLSKLELLALILKYIKILIVNKYSVQIKKCILIVPTFLSMGLKSLLKMSAKIVELNDVEILSESLAVAIYYYYTIFEKKQDRKKEEEDYLLINKVERSHVESWLFLMNKDELQMRELVNCAMLQDYTNKEVHSNGKLKVQISDYEIPKIVKNLNHVCLQGYEKMYSTRLSTFHSISYKNILYSCEEKIKNMLKPEVDLPDHTALFGGIIWANKEYLDDSNLRNLKISTSTPYIINISTEREKFSRSLKLYNELYHDSSSRSSLPLKTICRKGENNIKFNITEVITITKWKNQKILNQIQLEWEFLEEKDELTWKFDQDGSLNFFLLVQPNTELLPIQSTWIFNSIPMDAEYLQKSSKQVEKIYSGELNEIFKDRKELEEMMQKSKLDMNSKKDLNQTLKGRLEEIFNEIARALVNEKSSKEHLKELKEKLDKYNRILSK